MDGPLRATTGTFVARKHEKLAFGKQVASRRVKEKVSEHESESQRDHYYGKYNFLNQNMRQKNNGNGAIESIGANIKNGNSIE